MVLSAEDRRRISRENGARSLGPKTVAGKNTSRANARTHGLSGQTPASFGAQDRGLLDPLAGWIDLFQPATAAERSLIERAFVASVQRRRCIVAAHQYLAGKVEAGMLAPAAEDDGFWR
jgi:hypothetical protein